MDQIFAVNDSYSGLKLSRFFVSMLWVFEVRIIDVNDQINLDIRDKDDSGSVPAVLGFFQHRYYLC